MPLVWKEIEEKWQKRWAEAKVFEADPDSNPSRLKFFLTVAYPYPNSPQHIGHGRTYTLADVHARYRRMRGYNTLLPMGFHYTGTPILAMAKRLAAGDEELITTFREIYKVPPQLLEEFKDPLKIATYFHEEIREGMKKMGYSIDFRREFTTIDPQYSRFIEWQFRKLRERGFISQGSHAVGWCPSCGHPVGQHDTRGDVEPEIEEFTLIKFKNENFILPTGTLRPETIFGVTNIWVNPGAEYVEANVDGENQIISAESVEKLRLLAHKVEVKRRFPGKFLIGKYVSNPATGKKVPILPARFVNPAVVTGVVMSVPAHAPYDCVALEEVRRSPEVLAPYGLGKEDLGKLEPISIIELPGYSESPAADVVREFKIKDQTDTRLEEATRVVYRHEFHSGRMKANTGCYAGLSVAEAKEAVKRDLIQAGAAGTMYELANRPILCRCGTECVVKIFENQWFIDYGNAEWKRRARECLSKMSILPDEMRREFTYVIEWLKEKACARRSGLGTRLPWDPSWIIESLSDSTIYMAYYLLAKYINREHISADQLTDAVFDYVFFGEGDVSAVSKSSNLNVNLLKEMRREFTYFYPLDARHSGRDLVTNHLTYFIFNHVAIFPEALWPRQIVVNGSVLMEGQKMSKSLGNIIPLREAIAIYGADPLRISLLATAGLLQDADFSANLARSMSDRLERLYNHAVKVASLERPSAEEERNLTWCDRWLISRVQRHIQAVTETMEKLEVMKACQIALYLLDQDVQWYLRRSQVESPERRRVTAGVLRETLDIQIRLLAPFIPHLAEEVWSLLGKEGFVALANWPSPSVEKIDLRAEELESIIISVVEDTKSILKATNISPRRICYYTASDWKWRVYLRVLEATLKNEASLPQLIREVTASYKAAVGAESAVKFLKRTFEVVSRAPRDRLEKAMAAGLLDETAYLKEAQGFLESEFNASIEIYREDDPAKFDPQGRSFLAEPHRPGIYVE
ncbi:MAG: leucine--tRNA ligase [Candidatus Bathyarchaeia archaeon]